MTNTPSARFTNPARLANARAIVRDLEAKKARGRFLTRHELQRLANAKAIVDGRR